MSISLGTQNAVHKSKAMNPKKNPHLQRHILKTETHHELMNSRIHPKTRKKLNSRLGGLAKGMKLKSEDDGDK
jgi:hypothetical protein